MIVILVMVFVLNVLGSENMVQDDYVKLINKLTLRIEHLENDIKVTIKREVDMAVDEKMVRGTPGEFISRGYQGEGIVIWWNYNQECRRAP